MLRSRFLLIPALMAACAGAPRHALAIGEKPVEATRVKAGDKGEINPFLKESIDDTVRKSLRVAGERAGYIVLDTQGRVYTRGTYVLFFRKTEVGLDMMARGEIKGVEGEEALIKLDLDEIIKVPADGDLAVPLAAPTFGAGEENDQVVDASGFEPPEIPGDPGHIQATYGFFFGDLDTETTTLANAYKKVPGYRFRYLQIEWYPEFLWRWGIEYEKYGGDFPTFSYYHTAEKTSQAFTKFVANYRFRRMWKGKFRPSLRMAFMSDDFTTTNPDEAVISSTYSSVGLGARAAVEFVSTVWTTRRVFPFFALHRVYLDGMFFPIVSATDPDLSRGTSASGTAFEWRAGLTGFMYFNWIPLIKRWVVEFNYGSLSYNLSFSGKTVSQDGSPYTIDPGTVSNESTSYWTISVGIRLDDMIGKFVKPANN